MSTRKTPTPIAKSIAKKTPLADAGKPASELIDARIAELDDWRGALLGQLRGLIRATGTDVLEEWKWNVPVWSCCGIICTGETYKKAVKLTFPQGAVLADPGHLFNSSLDGNVRRAIDFPQGCSIDEAALTALIREAITHNRARSTAQ